MTISEALKELYVAIGGDINDVGNCNSSTEILNKFSVFLGGTGSATQDSDAIMNIVAHAEGLGPATLIDKSITANGTYNATDDNADGYKKAVVNVQLSLTEKNVTANGTYNASSDNVQGYSKVVVDVGQLNTIKYVEGDSFSTASKSFEKVSVPEGYTALYYDNTYKTSLASAVNLRELYLPSTIEQSGIYAAMFSRCTALEKIIINKPEGSITGAPWGAPASCQVIWLG